ncbi:hypothetical protein KX75_20185 [Salmonella enterica subsp. enterica]|nr:hypothetical protein [Salmonella enterica subsp. enterica serovar Mikawasima]
MSMDYVFIVAGEPAQDDITAAVQMFCYAPILNSITISDEGTANPSIYFSNGGDHLVFNELANTDLPSDIYFLSLSDFDGEPRNYEASDLKFSGN